jgi:hypothetical protein
MIAWIFAVLLITNVNDRRLVVIAGVAMDIDAIFILFNEELFYQYHHTFGHSYIFGILLAVAGASLATNKKRVFIVALGAFTLHLLADIIGSNWAVYPLYPIYDFNISISPYLSDGIIYGIINPIVFVISLIIIVSFMYNKELSPLEFISEKLDRKITGYYIFPLKYKCDICGSRAFGECSKCGRKICPNHLSKIIKSKCPKCSGLKTSIKQK